MKFETTAEQRVQQPDETDRQPSPMNWILMLLILAAYLVFLLAA